MAKIIKKSIISTGSAGEGQHRRLSRLQIHTGSHPEFQGSDHAGTILRLHSGREVSGLLLPLILFVGIYQSLKIFRYPSHLAGHLDDSDRPVTMWFDIIFIIFII